MLQTALQNKNFIPTVKFEKFIVMLCDCVSGKGVGVIFKFWMK